MAYTVLWTTGTKHGLYCSVDHWYQTWLILFCGPLVPNMAYTVLWTTGTKHGLYCSVDHWYQTYIHPHTSHKNDPRVSYKESLYHIIELPTIQDAFLTKKLAPIHTMGCNILKVVAHIPPTHTLAHLPATGCTDNAGIEFD